MFLGIDPSLRHTGLCLIDDRGEPRLSQVDTHNVHTLEATHDLRQQLGEKLGKIARATTRRNIRLTVTVEKQLPVGGQSSALMFHVMMLVLGTMEHYLPPDYQLVMPLPNQLKSYLQKRHSIITSKGRKTPIVQAFREEYGPAIGRVSSHKAEAYYLALLGKEVMQGTWKYTQPSKEAPLLSRRIHYGGSG